MLVVSTPTGDHYYFRFYFILFPRHPNEYKTHISCLKLLQNFIVNHVRVEPFQAGIPNTTAHAISAATTLGLKGLESSTDNGEG